MPANMRRLARVGCLSVVGVALATVLALYYFFVSSLGPRLVEMRLMSYGRFIWVGVMSGNMDRADAGASPIWPRGLGFDRTRTSTEHFRRLMMTEAGRVATGSEDPLVPDLCPDMLGGHGVRVANSLKEFGPDHNAWIVVCIGATNLV